MIPSTPLHELLTFAEDTARRAGATLRAASEQPPDIAYKGTINLVTRADQESEGLILAALHDRYPEHAILSEESGDSGQQSSAYIWIIDPLDGTTNFAHGYPVYSVSIALRDERDFLLGVIYDPTRDECFTAARGQGAFLNGRPIHVTGTAAIERALLATGFPYDRHEAADNNSAAFSTFLRRAQGIRRGGSAALDLAYVACGRFDGFWEMRLHAWDVAAGILIVREAGGLVTDYQGNRDSRVLLEGRRLVASNGAIHTIMLDTLAEVYAQIPMP